MSKRITLIFALLLAGCSITQNIDPTQLSTNDELCIVENPAVRAGFLPEFQSALTRKGIRYRMVEDTSSAQACEWISTYLARWTWDLSIYMSYAEIRVFKNGVLDGEAIYDSTRGGANMNKFIDAEPKIRELVDQLFVTGSSSN